MNFIVFDLECTCWQDGSSPPTAMKEIIEIGAYIVNDFGEVEEKFSRFVRPVVNPYLSPFCKQLTTITQEQVNRAKKYPEVIDEFLDWAEISISDDYVLCSWGDFDRKQLIENCHLHRLESKWVHQHIDLREQYQNLKRLKNTPSLVKILDKENLEFSGTAHRAIADAANLVKIFCKYRDYWKF